MTEDSLAALHLSEAEERMAKATQHVREELGGIRTGRASAALVERLVVSYYGVDTPLQQLAGFHVPEARLLVITPYDKGAIQAIEKALLASDLGINPSSDGQVIRLAFPPLTEERRRELAKVARHKAEEGKVAVRNVRRSARHDLEALEHEGEISSDELERAEKQLERMTHEHVAQVDEIVSHKEQELLEG